MGKLQLATGGAVDGRVRIELHGIGGMSAEVQYTDATGNFKFLGLQYGRYEVVLVSDRFAPVSERVDLFKEMETRRLILYATPLSTPSASPSTPTADPFSVSVKELRQTYPAQAVKEYENGLKRAQSGDVERAISAYLKAVEIAPAFYLAHNNLGVLFMNAKQSEKAVECFQKAIQLNDKPASPYTNLGRIYFEANKLEQAREMLDKAILKDPRSATAAFLAGTVLFRQGDLSGGELQLKRSVQLDPTMFRAYLQLANLYMKSGDQARTVEALEAYLKSSPSDPQAEAIRQRIVSLKAQ